MTDSPAQHRQRHPRLRRDRDRAMDAAEEIRGAPSRQCPLSRLAHDQRAAHDPEGGGVGGAGSGLHGGERQRHAAGHGAANLLPGAPQDHGADRRQGACTTDISRRPCCPITSKSTASIGTSSTTRAGISRSRTPTGASAAGRSRSAIICTRRRSRTSSPPSFAGANVDVIGPSGNLSGSPVLRKGRVQPAVQGGEPRQPL